MVDPVERRKASALRLFFIQTDFVLCTLRLSASNYIQGLVPITKTTDNTESIRKLEIETC